MRLLQSLPSGEASSSNFTIEVKDADTGAFRAIVSGVTIPVVIDPKNEKREGSEFALMTFGSTTNNITTVTSLVRGLDPDGSNSITGSTTRAKQWEANTTIACATHFINPNRIKGVFDGTINTGGQILLIGDGSGNDITIKFVDDQGNSSFIRKRNANGDLVFSNNGIDTLAFASTSGVSTASSPLSITASNIALNLAAISGLKDEDGLKIDAKEDGGISIDGDGVFTTVGFPKGGVIPYAGSTAPTGFLLCDGSQYDCDTYGSLVDLIKDTYGKDSGNAFTADSGTDVFTDTAHGLSDGNRLILSNSGGALPSGLSVSTVYFVINKTDNTFQLSATEGGSAIDITTNGTGTHSWHNNFKVPDLRGRATIGLDNMGGSSANRITDSSADTLGGTFGAATHTLITDEIPAHTHTYTQPNAPSGTRSGGSADAVTGVTAAQPTSSTGGGSAHNNVQPSFFMNFIIKT